VGSEICPHLTSLKIIFRIGMMGKNSSLVHANIKLCRLMPKYSPVLSYSLFAFFVFVYFLCDVICLYMILFAFYMILFAFYMILFAFYILLFAFICSDLLLMCSYLRFMCSYLIYLCLPVLTNLVFARIDVIVGFKSFM
jgi:hypothetical protein